MVIWTEMSAAFAAVLARRYHATLITGSGFDIIGIIATVFHLTLHCASINIHYL
jgi:hypothetical protein